MRLRSTSERTRIAPGSCIRARVTVVLPEPDRPWVMSSRSGCGWVSAVARSSSVCASASAASRPAPAVCPARSTATLVRTIARYTA